VFVVVGVLVGEGVDILVGVGNGVLLDSGVLVGEAVFNLAASG
jgi:hypothetical protein